MGTPLFSGFVFPGSKQSGLTWRLTFEASSLTLEAFSRSIFLAVKLMTSKLNTCHAYKKFYYSLKKNPHNYNFVE